MSEEDVAALARLAGLNIDPAHLPGVIRNLETLLDQAALLMATALPAEVEPAAIFRP